MKTKLYLRKCAYIFDWSNSTFSHGTRSDIEHKHNVNNILKEYYYKPEMLKNPIDCEIEDGKIFVTLDNQKHQLKPIQIASIINYDSVINHRRIANVSDIESKFFHIFTQNSLYSNTLKTLEFEFFTNDDDLGYIRVHFKNNRYTFFIDDLTNELYDAETYQLKKINREYIIKYLEITSKKALDQFNDIMDKICYVKAGDL